MNGGNVTYFDGFGVEYIPKEIKKFVANIYRKHVNGSIMCEYFCIGFVDFMLKAE